MPAPQPTPDAPTHHDRFPQLALEVLPTQWIAAPIQLVLLVHDSCKRVDSGSLPTAEDHAVTQLQQADV